MKALPSLFAVSFLVFTMSSGAWAQDDGGTLSMSDGATYGSSISDGMVNLNAGPTDPFWGGELSVGNEIFDGSQVILTDAETINDLGSITLRDQNTTVGGPLIGSLILTGGGTGALTLNQGTTIVNSFTGAGGTLTMTGMNYYTGFDGVTLTVMPGNGTIGTISEINEPLTISGTGGQATSNALVINGGSDSGGITTDSIPEPSAAILLVGGLALLGRRRQRRTA